MINVKDKNGKVFMVSKKFFESDLKYQGYTVIENNKKEKHANKNVNKDIENIMLIPVEDMTKEQLRKVAMYKNIDCKDCKNIEEVRVLVEKHIKGE